MSKKGGKATKTVTTIDNVNMNIDYDRLAEAIVKAEHKANDVKSYTSNTFAALSGMIFRIVASVGFIVSIAGIIGGGASLFQYDWGNANLLIMIPAIILVLLVLLLLLVFSFLLFKSAKEIEGEKDRQFVVAVFSAIVSFTALIVALVALYK